MLLLLHQIILYVSDVIMSINDEIIDAKLQYDINREAAKIIALYQVIVINMGISLAKKYYFLFKVSW